jgi:hypothetical protein
MLKLRRLIFWDGGSTILSHQLGSSRTQISGNYIFGDSPTVSFSKHNMDIQIEGNKMGFYHKTETYV